ncbi:MAG: hypothetical protein HKN87_20100 [Saprospiraceae bacterium]|nr:hypothetical protein [Saprospiraceae bacterium]
MIKFFRRIRQELLVEGNFFKYLMYALGEIILVVIGILIALQINGWNENLKKEKLKASYEISLRNDLSSDTLLLGKLIRDNYKLAEILSSQQVRFLGPEAPLDTLVAILRNEFDPELNTRFKYNRKTFNTLIASGNIDLFTQEFNEMLMALISAQDIERERTNYYTQIYTNKISRFSDDYPVSRRQDSKIVNSIWADADKRELAARFISLTDIKGFSHYTFISEIENVRDQTSAILKHIHN